MNRTITTLAGCALLALVCHTVRGDDRGEDAEKALTFADIVKDGATVRQVADGFRFTEGPAWDGKSMLLFSDIPASRIVELLPDGTTRDFLAPSGRANGLMFDTAGYLYACQGGERRVVRVDIAGGKKITPIAERFEGKPFNSPNDLALDGRGGLYFTDPRYGRSDDLEQPVMGVYYVDKSGAVTRVIDSLERPNGILVSPDGKTLWVAEPNRRELYRFSIDAPGKISGKQLVYTGDAELDGGGPDGMAHDEHGNVYATYSGIVVLDPKGKLLGRIAVPERPANCTFGGKENRTLFITARRGLYAIDLGVRGAPLRPGVGAAPASVATRAIEVGGLELLLPSTWKQTEIPPALRQFRLAQFEIPLAAGDEEPAELVVYRFPGGRAGTDAENVKRWIDQFESEGRKSATEKGTSKLGEYTLVEITGTYNKSVGPPFLRQSKPVAGARMVAAILHAGKETLYLKATGLEKTMTGAATALKAAFGAPAK